MSAKDGVTGSTLTRETILRGLEALSDDLRLPADWLNDGVKGFISTRHETTTGNLPQFPHLRLTMPVPEYLLAMKRPDARMKGFSRKLGIDGTKKIPGEGFKRPWPPLIKMEAAVKAKVEKLFNL